ncbi:MAG TPA: ArsR family transcriptional regulator [Firmicutes bacterium]|jgi:DNA-binding transcriptional ArsR family regulator|nr:ArsR family transcriptional regulator [Bacillota bacterium]HAZ20777.1 ArsR family transcriptional regulator [Bacillota bacterium]HBE06041.1 ArsR family transcriptional regulator [Bacillota bacterium]HBG44284.1 ArsR family transcriptional regulator [Bacillota bacterium]HBL49110.1 ArsR family transcriptional regulator [Bacillota bacterium]
MGSSMRKIKLTTKKELNIYMNPVRQELLHILNVSKKPMTAKMLANELHISVSSVQHHISKLMSLELVEMDHSEVIHGIIATFYKPAPVTVQIGLNCEDSSAPQRQVLMQEAIARTYDRFQVRMKEIMALKQTDDESSLARWGDILTGILYLEKKESAELMNLINAYIEKHSCPSQEKSVWEYALILFNADDLGDSYE